MRRAKNASSVVLSTIMNENAFHATRMMRTSSLYRHPTALRRLWGNAARFTWRRNATRPNVERRKSKADIADGVFAKNAPSFEGFGLNRHLLDSLFRNDIQRPTQIQVTSLWSTCHCAFGVPSLGIGHTIVDDGRGCRIGSRNGKRQDIGISPPPPHPYLA